VLAFVGPTVLPGQRLALNPDEKIVVVMLAHLVLIELTREVACWTQTWLLLDLRQLSKAGQTSLVNTDDWSQSVANPRVIPEIAINRRSFAGVFIF
jgi:hypothetical protein